MSDVITLRGLTAEARHGVLAAEHFVDQPFIADVDLEVDLAAAAASDDLAQTVSYADVADAAYKILTGERVDLIETLAGRIADHCLSLPAVQSVTVRLHKPHAPIPMRFTDAAVCVHRDRNDPVVIALGANLDDPAGRLADAVRRLAAVDGLDLVRLSPLVASDPVGGPPGQSSYLNAVLIARTRLAPWVLLRELHAIEALHGRTRTVRWEARTLDLDLIQYGDPGAGSDYRSESPDLLLPHPRTAERAFVLAPWLVADPAAVLRAGAQVRPVADVLAGLAGLAGAAGAAGQAGEPPRPGPAWPQWVSALVWTPGSALMTPDASATTGSASATTGSASATTGSASATTGSASATTDGAPAAPRPGPSS